MQRSEFRIMLRWLTLSGTETSAVRPRHYVPWSGRRRTFEQPTPLKEFEQ